MPELKLKPGVDVESSPFLASLQLNASNLIRFYAGRAQKLGGWQNINAGQPFIGTCRGMHGWADIPGITYLATGTEQRLQVFAGGVMQDITPVSLTTNPAVSFTTVTGQASVTITDAGAAPAIGDWINLLTQVSVGGIVLFGFYRVIGIGGANQYIVNAATPATSSVTGGAVPSYTTTNGQATVSVTLNNHGYVTGGGGTFNAAVATTVATIVISGLYAVTSVTNANTFVITAISTANASTTASENAGNARIQYLLPSGQVNNVSATGYGAGDYGAGDYGGFSGGSTILPMRQWSLDHFGQDLIASPSNGRIYFWQPPNVIPATSVGGTSPTASTAVFVMPQSQIIMALGAEIGGTQQPLLVRWCNAADFTDWTASVSNLAGSYSVPTGSGCVGGLAIGLTGALIWTDVSLVSVSFLGFPLVFSFNPVALGCGLVGARAAGVIGPLVMWLGKDQPFKYVLGGGVTPIECSVWDFYIDNVDKFQTGAIHCAPNSNFNEFTWHFPLSQSSPLWNALAPMAYIKYNFVEDVWDYGLSSQYQRTSWVNQSPMGNPIGADLTGLLQQHEVGRDADGAAMQWSWQAAFAPLSENADDFMFADHLIPDFNPSIGDPSFTPTIFVTDYPNNPATPVTCQVFNTSTPFVVFSARGRYISIGFRAHDTALGTFWRLGKVTVRARYDGSGP